MNHFNVIITVLVCAIVLVVCVVVGGIAQEPVTLALEKAKEDAQAANAEAQADLSNARAVEAGAEADLVTAQGNADALRETVEGALGILRWVSVAAPLSAPAYIGFGVTLGLAVGGPAGALWMLERELKRREAQKPMLLNVSAVQRE